MPVNWERRLQALRGLGLQGPEKTLNKYLFHKVSQSRMPTLREHLTSAEMESRCLHLAPVCWLWHSLLLCSAISAFINPAPQTQLSAGVAGCVSWDKALMRARDGLKGGCCSLWLGRRWGEEGVWWGEGRAAEGDKKNQTSPLRWWGAARSAQSPRVYTLSKWEQLRHEYVFPSAYFAPGMVISQGGEADSCRVWLAGWSASSWQCGHLKNLLAEGNPSCLKQGGRIQTWPGAGERWASWSSPGDLSAPMCCYSGSWWPATGAKKNTVGTGGPKQRFPPVVNLCLTTQV